MRDACPACRGVYCQASPSALLTILNAYPLRLLDRFSTENDGWRGASEQPATPDAPDIENEQGTQALPIQSLPIQTFERTGSDTPEDDGAQSPETETLREK